MDIFLKIYPVAFIIVGSGEAFFVIGEPSCEVNSQKLLSNELLYVLFQFDFN